MAKKGSGRLSSAYSATRTAIRSLSKCFPAIPKIRTPLLRRLTKLKGRFGVHAITFVGDRGMIKGQQIEDLAQQGFHYITAITKPQIEKLLRTGTLQMDLFDQELAEVLADEGIRYVLRRNPVRAQEVRDTRHAKLATLQAQVAKQNQYLTDHPRAKAQGALQKLVARAKKLRIADWVELTVEERSITLTINEDAQTRSRQTRWLLCAQNRPDARASTQRDGA